MNPAPPVECPACGYEPNGCMVDRCPKCGGYAVAELAARRIDRPPAWLAKLRRERTSSG